MSTQATIYTVNGGYTNFWRIQTAATRTTPGAYTASLRRTTMTQIGETNETEIDMSEKINRARGAA